MFECKSFLTDHNVWEPKTIWRPLRASTLETDTDLYVGAIAFYRWFFSFGRRILRGTCLGTRLIGVIVLRGPGFLKYGTKYLDVLV